MAKIKKISAETRAAIKRKSAFSLPDNPTGAGYKADDIRRALYTYVVDSANSLISELDRIIDEANSILNSASSDIDSITGRVGERYMGSGGLSYMFRAGQFSVIGAEGLFGKVVIPSLVLYDGLYYPVTNIYYGAFANDCEGITEIKIPASVIGINDRAFIGCSSLGKVTLLGLTGFGEEVFQRRVDLFHVPMEHLSEYEAAIWEYAGEIVGVDTIKNNALDIKALKSGSAVSIESNIAEGTNTVTIKLKNREGEEISTEDIDLGVDTGRIIDGAVTEEKLKNAAVTNEKLADSSVAESKLGTGSVTNEKLSDSAVTESKLRAGAVTNEKLADSAVTESKLRAGAVTNEKLGDLAVTKEKLRDGAVTSEKIPDGEIPTQKLANKSVVRSKIGDAAVGSPQIASGAVTKDKLSSELISRLTNLEKEAFVSISYTPQTGVLSFTSVDGTVESVDLPLELLLSTEKGSSYYDTDTQDLVLTLANGEKIYIPLDNITGEIIDYINGIKDSIFHLQKAPPLSALSSAVLLTTPTLAQLAGLAK